MKKSATGRCIENAVLHGTPVVYGAVWAIGIGISLPFSYAWWIAVLAATAYATMHGYEIVKRGHCYRSADSTAVPVSAVVYIAAIALFGTTSDISLQIPDYVTAIAAYGTVLIIGHIAVMAFSFDIEPLLHRIFRNRIRMEKKSVVAAGGQPS